MSRMRLADPAVVASEVEHAGFDLAEAVLGEFRSIPEVMEFVSLSGELIRSERLSSELSRLRYAEGMRQVADRMSGRRPGAVELLYGVGPVSSLLALVSATRIVAQATDDRVMLAAVASKLAGSPNLSMERLVLAAVAAVADHAVAPEDFAAVVSSMSTLCRFFDGLPLSEVRGSVSAALDALAEVYEQGAGPDREVWAAQLYQLADDAVAGR